MTTIYKTQVLMYCNPKRSSSGRKWYNDKRMTADEAKELFLNMISIRPDMYYGYRLRNIETNEIVFEYIAC